MDVLRKEFIEFLPTVLPLSSSTPIISLSSSSVKEESLTHQRPTPASLWPSLPSSMVILLNWLPFLSPESSTSLSPFLLSLTLNKQTSLEFTSPFHLWSCLSSSSHEIYWKSILYTWPPVSLLLFLSSCSIVRALTSLRVAKVRGFRSLSCHLSTIWLCKFVAPWASKTLNSLGFAPFSLVTFLQCLYPTPKGCCPQLSNTPPVLSSTSIPLITTLRGVTHRSTVDLQEKTQTSLLNSRLKFAFT